MAEFRLIPSIESVLQRPALAEAIDRHGRESVARAARQAADELRHEMTQDATVLPDTERAAAAWIEQRTTDALRRRTTGSLRPVINATGVILHTNLGRAPLARAAADRAARLASGYSNLEYDLDAGARGHRDAHTARLLSELTGAESAAVVNNNAAATLLVLTALAAGREVVVSRGELVEIGGGFRIPDVMRQSGASLREVGTTNRTRLGDYSAAVNDRTALILRVHPSNFRIEGFTERPSLEDLVSLGRRFNVPVFEDLGSGWLGAPAAGDALADEPVVSASVHAGADLVAFSGDKLLGGPQAGIIVGRADLVERVRRHPLMRALRADKLTYAALEVTLALWSDAPARSQIPVYRMLSARIDEIERRARQLAERLSNATGVRADIIDGESTTGGGSAPQSSLPTKLVALRPSGLSAAALDRRLRMGDPPVLTRIVDDAVVVDLRTVADEETAVLADAIASALQQ